MGDWGSRGELPGRHTYELGSNCLFQAVIAYDRLHRNHCRKPQTPRSRVINNKNSKLDSHCVAGACATRPRMRGLR
jgi:hypothetical protein